MEWLEPKSKTNSRNKRWVEFVDKVSFTGMTLNNKKALEAVANNYKGGRCVLTFKEIGNYMGCTKATAKNNMKKLSNMGLVRINQQYGGSGDKLPYYFSVNTRWRELP